MSVFRISLLLALFTFACGEHTADELQSTTTTAKVVLPPPPEVEPQGIPLAALRALSRHPSSEDRGRLKRILTAENDERLWASFGLGLGCRKSDSEKTHGALTNAIAAWASETTPPPPSLLNTAAWALGKCAAPDAEKLFLSWLTVDPNIKAEGLIDAGVLGLSALADQKGSLSERTQRALLDLTLREKRAELLLPLGRLGRLSESVGAQVLEAAGAMLISERKTGRRQAAIALGGAGPSATAPLSQVLLGTGYAKGVRAAAAQSLERLGDEGQKALDKSVALLLERGIPLSFDRATWIPLRAALNALKRPKKSRASLQKLRSVVLSEGEDRQKVAQRRRLIWLRCRAADLLAGDQYESAALLRCSPQPTRPSQLSRLRVIARGALVGARYKAFHKALQSEDPVIAQAALRLIPSHPELKNAGTLLVTALGSKLPGTQATAAQIIAAVPSRVLSGKGDLNENEELISTLGSILKDKDRKLPLETRAAALSAAGALQALSLQAQVEALCASEFEALWAPAERSLSLLGKTDLHCPSRKFQKTKAEDEESDTEGPTLTLRIDSDVGELLLHLSDTSSPQSRTRFLARVDDGFYNGIQIHGERPGFAVQFGDKDGDGYDESFAPPLPHEVTPTPFSALSFGMSAFSQGSQDSQIFVVLSNAPQLTGSRVRLGTAEGPWDLLTVGDVLHTVQRAPPPQ